MVGKNRLVSHWASQATLVTVPASSVGSSGPSAADLVVDVIFCHPNPKGWAQHIEFSLDSGTTFQEGSHFVLLSETLKRKRGNFDCSQSSKVGAGYNESLIIITLSKCIYKYCIYIYIYLPSQYVYINGDKYTLTHRWWFQPLVNQIDLRMNFNLRTSWTPAPNSEGELNPGMSIMGHPMLVHQRVNTIYINKDVERFKRELHLV